MKLTEVWDKYFFVVFYSALTGLFLMMAIILIFKPPLLCVELDNESFEVADDWDLERKCFSSFFDYFEHNEYLNNKYGADELGGLVQNNTSLLFN